MEPYQINVAQAVLDDLQTRLANTRWPDETTDAGWQSGTDPAYLRQLVTYWQTRFDWRKQEQVLNQFAHYRTNLDGYGLHVIHERGKGGKPMPLLLSHGWPDSFYRFVKLIPLLTDPVSHGGKAEDTFDVILPSLPGYGFSEKIQKTGAYNQWTANVLHTLMTRTLGYERYAAHGGDVGSGVTEALGMLHPESLIGIHMTDVPYWRLFATNPDTLSEPERNYLRDGQQWQMQEGAYAMLQATKPQTLAYGLTDSPVGLASWIIEKFYAWSDCNGNLENSFTKDDLLSNILIYWTTGTIQSSFIPYWDEEEPQANEIELPRIDVPTGLSIFPKDIVPAPRQFAERFYNLQYWSEPPKGGHFAALEEPERLADELRAFFRPLR
ncbi:epoxide hydrolase [Fibrisoma montanum]|uniref:Epoxide hydrolase n=1 Tax=Fibrisoma montanum TaxID=2305895 RepID=A0A418MFI6_9BACT|nr:epoxide hydrolase family protein [Fibrisoma montanum]RIV25568.1 epoxide hydrolase [Fibrisoma montanum]